MKRATTLSVLGLFAALASLGSAGCALDEEGTAREPAYPVGYTPPADLPAAQARPQDPRAIPPPPQGAPPGAAYSQDAVSVGEDETSADGPAPGTDGSEGDPDQGQYADTDPAALTDFRAALDPYGSWREDPTYGTVWVPSSNVVGSDFTPYVSAGHWEYDNDYVWASDYDWGWAPFHYGRWVYGGADWEWVPGRVYSGAWVSWRYGVDDWAYVGWAPLAPLWCWRGGRAVGVGFVPSAPYAFVPSAHLFSPQVGGRLATGASVGPIAAHTQPWSSPAARVTAHPAVSGPPPSTLHIQAQAVVRTSGSSSGLAQARAFARPASAVSLGARAPQGSAGASVRGSLVAGGARSASVRSAGPYAGAGSRASYSLGQANQSHFGGKLGAGFSGSAASAPPARSAPAYFASGRSYGGYSGPSTEGYRSSAGGYRAASPSYHSFAGGGPAVRSGGGGGGGGSSFHGGGGFSHGGGGGGHSGGGRR